MNYVDQIFGKDLKWADLGKLVFHFSVFQTPIAFPLSVMLASLMTFGNLGEHFELTAIKSAGISLVRALMPIFIMVMGITVIAFYSNNYFVPYSALKAYSLLYDIRQKKPALDIEPGQFYAGIENYKIKVDKKFPDGKTLKGLTIYDHSSHKGNNEVIKADSGQMYTILGDQYLKLELFNGVHYVEGDAPKVRRRGRKNRILVKPFTRTKFERSEMIFDLSSFSMSRTDEGLFASHRMMRNFSELNNDLDSIKENIYSTESEIYGVPARYFNYSIIKKNIVIPDEIIKVNHKKDSLRKLEVEKQRLLAMGNIGADNQITVNPPPKYMISLAKPTQRSDNKSKSRTKRTKSVKKQSKKTPTAKIQNRKTEAAKITLEHKVDLDSAILASTDTSFSTKELLILSRVKERNNIKAMVSRNLKSATAMARQIKSRLTAQNDRKERLLKEYYTFDIQWQKMLANAFACISMFLIGAPLGAIIKRGGLGFPVIISVVFFIIYYVLSIGGEKYAKAGNISVIIGVWNANLILLPIGLIFLRQAKNDARLFEADFYKVMISRLANWLQSFHKPLVDN